jgi:hypothetical protein
MRNYDLSKAFRNTERARRLKENGCRIIVTRGEGDDQVIVEERFVTPEEIQSHDLRRKNRRVQN